MMCGVRRRLLGIGALLLAVVVPSALSSAQTAPSAKRTPSISPAHASAAAHASTWTLRGLEGTTLGGLKGTTLRGLKVKKRDVLWGNAHRSTAPAEVDLAQAIAATREGRRIEDEGIERGSARYDILMAKANARVRTVVRRIAIANSRDCVVKSASYRNPDGLPVSDLTSKVVDALGGDS